MSKLVRVKLDANDENDPRKWLKAVADSFGDATYEIEITSPRSNQLKKNEIITSEVVEAAKDALARANEVSASGNPSTVLAKVEVKKVSNREWIKQLGFEGVKATVQAIVKAGLENIF